MANARREGQDLPARTLWTAPRAPRTRQRRRPESPGRRRCAGGWDAGSGASLGGEAIDDHDDDRADDGEEHRPQAPRIAEDAADALVAEQTADEAADDRSDDAEDDRGAHAHGLLAGHDRPGDEADDRTDDQPGDE